jgi:tetratricopeptide (TPR) repeat protein
MRSTISAPTPGAKAVSEPRGVHKLGPAPRSCRFAAIVFVHPTRAELSHAAEAMALLVSAGRNADAEYALAIAQAAAGDIDSADHSFRHATDTYEERRQWRQAAAVAHDWGSALRQARRLEQALDAFSRAALLTARGWSGRQATARGP